MSSEMTNGLGVRRIRIQVLAASSPGVGAGPADSAAPEPVHDVAVSDEQAALIHRILSSYFGDLRMEISATDNPAMRRDLRHEEELLREIIPLFA